MALFDIFKKKKNKDIPVPQPEPVPDSLNTWVEPDPNTMPVWTDPEPDSLYPPTEPIVQTNPIPLPADPVQTVPVPPDPVRTIPVPLPSDPVQTWPSPKPPKASFTLTFRDAQSGKSLTDSFSGDTHLHSIIARLEEEKILSFPKQYIAIPGVESLRRRGSHFPDVNDISGVYSGMTLTVDIRQAKDPQLRHFPHLREKYPLVFYRMENKVCVEKIKFVGYGYEYPDDILSRMQDAHLIPDSWNIGYNILYWPTREGLPTLENPLKGRPLPLCEFEPGPEHIFILQDYTKTWEPTPLMYGCPTAAMPEQQAILAQRCTDILTFD